MTSSIIADDVLSSRGLNLIKESIARNQSKEVIIWTDVVVG